MIKNHKLKELALERADIIQSDIVKAEYKEFEKRIKQQQQKMLIEAKALSIAVHNLGRLFNQKHKIVHSNLDDFIGGKKS